MFLRNKKIVEKADARIVEVENVLNIESDKIVDLDSIENSNMDEVNSIQSRVDYVEWETEGIAEGTSTNRNDKTVGPGRVDGSWKSNCRTRCE